MRLYPLIRVRNPTPQILSTLAMHGVQVKIERVHSKVTQSWYADNVGADSTFTLLQAHLYYILARGSTRRYFSDRTNSILCFSTHKVA